MPSNRTLCKGIAATTGVTVALHFAGGLNVPIKSNHNNSSTTAYKSNVMNIHANSVGNVKSTYITRRTTNVTNNCIISSDDRFVVVFAMPMKDLAKATPTAGVMRVKAPKR
jgi:hypothetical protein